MKYMNPNYINKHQLKCNIKILLEFHYKKYDNFIETLIKALWSFIV